MRRWAGEAGHTAAAFKNAKVGGPDAKAQGNLL